MFNKLQKKHGEDFNWFEPSNKIAFEVELRKKSTLLDALCGLTLKAIGKNDKNDDVLFTDGADFYIIHLTWATAAKRRYIAVNSNYREAQSHRANYVALTNIFKYDNIVMLLLVIKRRANSG